MEEIFDYLSELNTVSVALRLLLASILGGIIGIERSLKRRPAGIRTFALVCVGAALAIISNEYLFLRYNMVGDPARIAAQVISGVGFLGAGTIILTGHNRVKGLTTAASLWATASVGIALGEGFYVGGIIGSLVIFITTTVLHNFDQRVSANGGVIEIYIEAERNEVISAIISYAHKNEYIITSFEKKNGKTIVDGDISILLELNMRKRQEHGEVIAEISILDGVRYAEEIR